MGLLAFVAVIVIAVTVGGQLGGTTGDGQSPATTWTIIGLLAGPAVLAGIVSGSRFYALYVGYSRRVDPTARLSETGAASGQSVVSGYLGDGLWGSLIAGIAASIPAAIAMTTFLGPVAVVALPVLALVAGIAWFTGWVSGAVASMIFSAAIGIAVGASRNTTTRTRLPWFLLAVFLPALLLTAASAAAVRFPDGSVNVVGGLIYLLGLPVDAEFLLGLPLLVVARLFAWLTVVLLVSLVSIGLPAFLNRHRAAPLPVRDDPAPPPVPTPPVVE